MLTDFNKMPPNSRIWIYQASTQLTDNQVVTIENHLKPAVEKWVAHGTALLASAKVLHNRFVIIALDESNYPASGCSIDASTHWLKELGAELKIDFFDRSIAYLQNDEIKTVSPFQIKQKVQDGIVSPQTVVFMNNINSFSELFSSWKNQAVDTYLKKYFLGHAV
jgi:hypothetical protein